MKKECERLFCNSKCPECCSDAVHVKLNVQYEYDNDSVDSIRISQGESTIELECEDCGEFFGYEPRLDPLYRALFKYLDLPGMMTFDCKHGEIQTTSYVSNAV